MAQSKASCQKHEEHIKSTKFEEAFCLNLESYHPVFFFFFTNLILVKKRLKFGLVLTIRVRSWVTSGLAWPRGLTH